jgi:membrane protein implicated in regulation of membrane protease activity
MGLVAPPASAGGLARIRGVVLIIMFIILVLAVGFGIVYGVGNLVGSLSVDLSIFYGFVLVLIVLGVLVVLGRRKQKRAQAERAEQTASRSR